MEAHVWKTDECLRAPPGTLAGDWKSREAYVQAPWRESPRIVMDECEKVVSVHDRMVKENTRVSMYTDGSGYQGFIGMGDGDSSVAATINRVYRYGGHVNGVRGGGMWNSVRFTHIGTIRGGRYTTQEGSDILG